MFENDEFDFGRIPFDYLSQNCITYQEVIELFFNENNYSIYYGIGNTFLLVGLTNTLKMLTIEFEIEDEIVILTLSKSSIDERKKFWHEKK